MLDLSNEFAKSEVRKAEFKTPTDKKMIKRLNELDTDKPDRVDAEVHKMTVDDIEEMAFTSYNDDHVASLKKISISHDYVVSNDGNFDFVPNEVVGRVFNNLDLKDRIIASQVCKRWRTILNGLNCQLDDLYVLNIFEKRVWDTTVSRNGAGNKVSSVNLSELDQLRTVFSHCGRVNSVKLWFLDAHWAEAVIDILSESDVDMKCIDLYPYSPDIVLNHLYSKLPETKGITMRPHGSSYFWEGLSLPAFPDFSQLQTLILDSFNLNPDVVLPVSITTLEFMNRGEGQCRAILPVLRRLRNLEYLAISHADLSSQSDMLAMLHTVQFKYMPCLAYLIFRFSKLHCLPNTALCNDESCDENCAHLHLMRLRMLKIDLCYGDIRSLVAMFAMANERKDKSGATRCFSMLSLNVIADIQSITNACQVSDLLKSYQIWLHFSILQKDKLKRGEESQFANFKPPESFTKVLAKFEASFVDDKHVLSSLLFPSSSLLPVCTDCKFINCPAADDAILDALSGAIHLRRLSLINCDETSEDGVRSFIARFDKRQSQHLTIMWKRHSRFSTPATFYLQLMHEHKHLLTQLSPLRARFFGKTFQSGLGEEVIVWHEKKSLCIRDYSEQDLGRIIGIVVANPFKTEEERRAEEEREKERLAKEKERREMERMRSDLNGRIQALRGRIPNLRAGPASAAIGSYPPDYAPPPLPLQSQAGTCSEGGDTTPTPSQAEQIPDVSTTPQVSEPTDVSVSSEDVSSEEATPQASSSKPTNSDKTPKKSDA